MMKMLRMNSILKEMNEFREWHKQRILDLGYDFHTYLNLEKDRENWIFSTFLMEAKRG